MTPDHFVVCAGTSGKVHGDRLEDDGHQADERQPIQLRQQAADSGLLDQRPSEQMAWYILKNFGPPFLRIYDTLTQMRICWEKRSFRMHRARYLRDRL